MAILISENSCLASTTSHIYIIHELELLLCVAIIHRVGSHIIQVYVRCTPYRGVVFSASVAPFSPGITRTFPDAFQTEPSR
jgi:hypothetical protein